MTRVRRHARRFVTGRVSVIREHERQRHRQVLETLAADAHERWMRWAKTLLENEPGISEARRARWQKVFVPYDDLPETIKEQDRKEARLALKALGSW